MKKKLISILIFIPMIFTSCLAEKSKAVQNKEEFTKVLSEINKRNEEILQKKLSLDEKYINWINKEEDLTDEECNNIMGYNNRSITSKVLSVKDAKEDVDMCFKILRCCYASYGYFGGDYTFLRAKENVLKSLEEKNEIPNIEFQELLFNNLSFLKDMHFYFNSNGYSSIDKISKKYYVFKDGHFLKDESGYYKLNKNKKAYVEEVNGDKEVNKFMKPTIGDNGKLEYTVAILDNLIKNENSSERELNIQYSSENSRTTEKVKLTNIDDKTRDYGREVYSIENNIPIAQLREMNMNQQEFIESGTKFKDYPVSIIDLRGTSGGLVIPGLSWFKNYSGEDFKMDSVEVSFNSNYIRHILLEKYNEDIGDKPLFQVHNENDTLNKLVPNKNIIFLLVDKANLSASELFIEYMKQMYNVILVGTNTAGCTLSLHVATYSLKNSGMRLNLGSAFHITPYFDGFEFKGFEPDILVESSQALEKVKKLIEYYELNKKK